MTDTAIDCAIIAVGCLAGTMWITVGSYMNKYGIGTCAAFSCLGVGGCINLATRHLGWQGGTKNGE